MSLSWLAVSSPDVYGYNVYRATTDPNGTYVRLTATPLTTTTYLDGSLPEGLAGFYKLTSVDTASMECAFRSIVIARIGAS